MSQILVSKNRREELLVQDLYFQPQRVPVKTTAQYASCAICEKSLQDGVSITAKKVGLKIRLFCQMHMPPE
ncbi:MAG: hypothetical protein ABI340_09765 [Nitrososphaera sp.]